MTGGLPGEARYFVYILASQRNGTLYIGVTGNIRARIFAHRTGARGPKG